jgi:hypothetical protein
VAYSSTIDSKYSMIFGAGFSSLYASLERDDKLSVDCCDELFTRFTGA